MANSDIYSAFETLVSNTTSFSAGVLEEVEDLIDAIGITLTSGDEYLLAFAVGYVENDIKNSCNVSKIPEGLYKVSVGLIVAKFLSWKKAKQEVDAGTLDFSPALKELSEGDTKQVWDTSSSTTAEQRLDMFISMLENGRSQFVTYRKIRWW